MSLLEVRGLKVHFPIKKGILLERTVGLVRAVDGVDLSVEQGRTLGVVGESGCGKSMTGLSIMRLIPSPPGKITSGEIVFNGRDVLRMSEEQVRSIRGNDIAMIFQDPMTSLNPVLTVNRQISESLQLHMGMNKDQARARGVELLNLVGIPNATERIDQYPHEFSGGMRQRVVIAIAMANQPDVIIADEPTTALDVTVQAQILDVLNTAMAETGAAMVLITHDLGVVAGVADKVLVMYAGRPVELGHVDEIYYRPRMPYTLGLLGSMPRLDATDRQRLIPIPGSPPSLVNMPPGCPFGPRCPLHIDECDADEPPLIEVGGGHLAACIRHEELQATGTHAEEIFDPLAVDDLLIGGGGDGGTVAEVGSSSGQAKV